MKIGLVGEAPHDTTCIRGILESRYPSNEYFALIDHIHGAQLDEVQPTKRILRNQYEINKPDLVVIIRDLDAPITDKKKKGERKRQFNALSKVVDKKSIFLLHVQEIEALILADIEKFGEIHDCDIMDFPDPCVVNDPKEELKKLSKKYKEIKNSKIFPLLDVEKMIQKCKYFKDFLKDFEKKLSA